MLAEQAKPQQSIMQTAEDLITEILGTPMRHAALPRLRAILQVGEDRDMLSGAHDFLGRSLAHDASEGALREALFTVDSLRELLRDCNGQRMEAVRKILGDRFIGPDTYVALGARVNDAIPVLPKGLDAKLLAAPCPFTPGRTIGDTHLLILVPAVLDSKQVTINNYDKLAAAAFARHGLGGAIFHRVDWYGEEPFANTAPSESHWTLLFKDIVPNTMAAGEAAQMEELSRYPVYEGAKAMDLMLGATLYYFQSGERLFSGFTWAKCADRTRSGDRVQVGSFSNHGLDIFNDYGGYCFQYTGMAVQRKL